MQPQQQQPPAVLALDRRKWAKRAFLLDVFALGVLLIVGVSLVRDAYMLGGALGTGMVREGYSTWINRLLLDVVVGMAAMGWLAYRVLTNGYRAIGAGS